MDLTRRQVLLGSLAFAAVHPVSLLLGCGSDEPPPDPILRVPLAEIPAEGRLEREHASVAVEFRRVDGEIRARSMICSHQLCRVHWKPEENHYLCPCDEGLFAADGTVKYGRAKKPLKELTVQIVGDEAWVDTHEIYRASS